MRPIVKHLLKAWKASMQLQEPVYEFGSFQVEAPDDDLRPIFEGMRYVGCDIRQGPGVDQIQDLKNLQIPMGEVGTAICVDTLEHVLDPIIAVHEMYRVLKNPGILILISVMNFPIHYEPDYWRFTPQCFENLLVGPFDSCKVYSTGGTMNHPETVAAIASKGIPLNETEWEKDFESAISGTN